LGSWSKKKWMVWGNPDFNTLVYAQSLNAWSWSVDTFAIQVDWNYILAKAQQKKPPPLESWQHQSVSLVKSTSSNICKSLKCSRRPQLPDLTIRRFGGTREPSVILNLRRYFVRDYFRGWASAALSWLKPTRVQVGSSFCLAKQWHSKRRKPVESEMYFASVRCRVLYTLLCSYYYWYFSQAHPSSMYGNLEIRLFLLAWSFLNSNASEA